MATLTNTMPMLSVEDLIREARSNTGLADFGQPDIMEPLTVLVNALNSEAHLTPEGAAGKHASLVRALSNRLLLANAVATHPEIAQQKITKPIFVVGLQRSGTTKLHRVLAANPGVQSLPLWRLLEPVSGAPREERIARAERFVDAMREASPQAYAAHPMLAEQPDEEVFVMELALLANINATAFRAPSFEAWLEQQSFEPWYVWFKRLLQYIQWADGTEGRPWVLKAPHHLGFLRLLVKTFPDATVAFCHRDPAVAIPSFAALAYAARSSTSESADPIETGRYCLNYCARRIATSLADRELPEVDERIVDIAYRDIVEDAEAVAKRVFDFAGVTFAEEAKQAVHRWEDNNRQHGFGQHRYAADEFGLDADEMRQAFAAYSDRFAGLIKA